VRMSTAPEASEQFSSQASLAAMGKRFLDMKLWDEVRQRVHIRQKVLRHTPADKLLDCFISMLAGGRGIVEVNTRVRPDTTVQRAFGRNDCAEQSTISETLSACTQTNVAQMREVLSVIFRQHSQTCRHDYSQQLNVLDIDMTGMPAGRQGEGVEKGYFPTEKKNHRGRQLGRVLAWHYDEVVCERLYPGKRQLETCLPELIAAAEDVLQISAPEAEKTRRLTVLRVDGGGGTDDHIHWMLSRSYGLIVKMRSWRRAKRLAHTVTQWHPDAKLPWREVGWVGLPQPFVEPTRQLALRHRKANGHWSYSVIVFNLADEQIAHLTGRALPGPDTTQALFNALHFYDLRGGGVETQTRSDKQGLALTHRNKRSFAAQEMLVLLAELAHNFIIWTRAVLASLDPHMARYGIQRTVRDVFHIDGMVSFAGDGSLAHVKLNPRHPLAAVCQRAFSSTYE
jgi:predicted RecA/RadA family phage recombinase